MRYQVLALGQDQALTAVRLQASDPDDARHQADARGLAVLSIRRDWPWPGSGAGDVPRLARFGRFPLVLFSQELLALLGAGLSLLEAFEALAEKEGRRDYREILLGVGQALSEGFPLSHALGLYPASFPPLYVASVRASEKSGDLEEALARYVTYQTQLDAVRKKVVSASIYPLLLVGAGALVTLFLLGYVVPRFSQVYQDMHTDLPWMSRLLLDWGELLATHRVPILGALVLALAVLVHTLARPATRAWLLRALTRIPALGERLRIYQLARFYRTLGMLQRGGMPLVSALDMADGLLAGELRQRLHQAGARLREGQAISRAMEEHGLTTPVALRMLRVGERTGDMGGMMERIAAFYDDEMARWVDWFTRLFEPLLMAGIGLVIGAIVVLMYLPIFDLASSVQ